MRTRRIRCTMHAAVSPMKRTEDFHSNLTKRRKALHLTQEQLAARMNVSPQAVSKWEKASYPDTEQLPKLAAALDLSLDALFGIRQSLGDTDPVQTVSSALQALAPDQRAELIAKLFYASICAFDPSADGETGRLRESYEHETYAGLHTDREIALQRLNPDLRYCVFLEKPETGAADYLRDEDRIVKLLTTLADADAIRMIKYMAGSCRNKLFVPEKLAERLGIPAEKVQSVINRLDRFGFVWRMAADLGEEEPVIMYGYTHNPTLAIILILAQSACNYLQNFDTKVDTYKYGTFQDRTTGNPDSVPQVSTWDADTI